MLCISPQEPVSDSVGLVDLKSVEYRNLGEKTSPGWPIKMTK